MSEAISAPRAGAPAQTGTGNRNVMIVFIGIMLGLLLASLDQTIVSTSIYTIIGDIGGKDGLSHVSWVVTAYLLTSTATTPLYGKISDLYGRKPLFIFAIVVFLLGSALCGLSQNLTELIAFRALQGVGAGGLMSLSFAIIGDLVPPRERGKYQGYIGSVFAVSMVAGPLIGGFFSDRPSIIGITGWRWVFYVNVPIGIIALVVISTLMHLPKRRTEHRIDFVGAALIVAGVCALLLVTEWGGQTYAWTSSTIIGLGTAGVVLLVAFVLWELRTPEPLLPMHLFRGSIFSLANSMTFIIGFGLMGSIIFISIYLQIVNGDTPTQAGLSLLPLMAGLLGTSITSGRIISRIGRYRLFPIFGMPIAAVGMFLMSRLDEHTSSLERSLFMFVLGAGIGMTMQVLVLAVQNSVSMRDMGTATSSTTFFRSMGGAFGTAVFQAILTNRLNHYIASGATAAGNGGPVHVTGTPSAALIKSAPPAEQHLIVHSYVQAMSAVFLTAASIFCLAIVLSWFLKDKTLRTTNSAPASGAKPEEAEASSAAVHV